MRPPLGIFRPRSDTGIREGAADRGRSPVHGQHLAWSGRVGPGRRHRSRGERRQAPLATTIDVLIRSNATAKLAVTSGDQSASLYFLFGHLFHAESGGLKGDDALEVALAWLHPSTTFDPRAHLPNQETILRPPAAQRSSPSDHPAATITSPNAISGGRRYHEPTAITTSPASRTAIAAGDIFAST